MKSLYEIILEEISYNVAQGRDQQTFADDVNWKGVIVWSTPDKFLSLVPRLPTYVQSTRLNIERLKGKIQQGQPIDPLVLIVRGNSVTSHEGRHRAVAAKELGIKQIPILVIPRDFPRVPQWTDKEYAFVNALNFERESTAYS